MDHGTPPTSEDLTRINRLATIARFVGGLAHELNNSLQVIGGLVELLSDRIELPADVLLRIQRIGSQSERASASIRQVMAFAREAPVELQSVELSAAAADAIALRRYQLGRAGITATIEGQALGSFLVRADPRQIRQILLNLLLNAEEALNGQYDRRIRVTLGRAGDRVHVIVEDSGPGVPQEIAERIFEPFFTTRTSERVLGLGLPVARLLAAAYGGQLTLQPRARGGAFLLDLPAADA